MNIPSANIDTLYAYREADKAILIGAPEGCE